MYGYAVICGSNELNWINVWFSCVWIYTESVRDLQIHDIDLCHKTWTIKLLHIYTYKYAACFQFDKRLTVPSSYKQTTLIQLRPNSRNYKAINS